MKSLELLEARQQIAMLHEELRRVSASDRRQRTYIKALMGINRSNLKLGNEIVTLKRQMERRVIFTPAIKKRLTILRRTGLYGVTNSEVAERLICDRLRELEKE